jgi:hypothetical protein
MDLVTLANAHAVGHLPKATCEKSTWQHVAAKLDKAAPAPIPAVCRSRRVEYWG